MKTIQQAVTDYVTENGTSKEALAKELGVSRSAFFMKMRGDYDFTLSEAYHLAKTLGCTMDDFYAMTQTA